MSDFVTFELADRIATLTMDDGKANAFGLEMIAALCDGLDRAEAEAEAVIITGRPGVLCAGFDLKIIRGDDEVAKLAMRTAGVEALLKSYMHPRPIIFACPGHSVAAGALLLLTGDVRIGARGDYKIGLNEVGIGLSLPEFGLSLARDRLDPRAISKAVLAAHLYDPYGAAEAGYLDQAVDHAYLMETAQRIAREMLNLDAEAFAATKQRLRQPTVDRIRASLAE
jgi:enoyl-CoA hydratase